MADITINTIKGDLKVGQTKIDGTLSTRTKSVNGSLKMPERYFERDYEQLNNLPQINGVTLIGNKTSADIKVQDQMALISEQDIDNMLFGG